MLIYLIRHPEVLDGELTTNGIQQLNYLLKTYAETRFDKVFSSTLGRAKKAAQALAAHNKLIPVFTDSLCEFQVDSNGTIDVKIIAQLKCIKKELKSMRAEKIAVVCHGNVIRWFISQELNISLKKAMKLDIYPCSTTLLVWKEDKGKVIFVNSYTYLPKEIRSDRFYGRRNRSAVNKMS